MGYWVVILRVDLKQETVCGWKVRITAKLQHVWMLATDNWRKSTKAQNKWTMGTRTIWLFVVTRIRRLARPSTFWMQLGPYVLSPETRKRQNRKLDAGVVTGCTLSSQCQTGYIRRKLVNMCLRSDGLLRTSIEINVLKWVDNFWLLCGTRDGETHTMTTAKKNKERK